MKKLVVVLLVAVLALSAVFAEGGSEKKYPNDSINVIVHAAAGGGSDTMARMVANMVQQDLGVPVVVDNKGGAGGSIAFTYVSKAKTDGYTIGTAATEIAYVSGLGYATICPDDVQFLGNAVSWAGCLAVGKDSPYQTFEDFLADAKKRPGEISVGNSSTGSIWHFGSATMQQVCGIKVNDVPFDGAAGEVTGLLSKQADAFVIGTNEIRATVESGDARVLAVFNDHRAEIYPDVPTAAEYGYPIKNTVWVGFLAPKGINEEAKNVLVAAIKKAVCSDEFAQFCKDRGYEQTYLDPEAYKQLADTDRENYLAIIKEFGLGQ
ncbi:MAG: tripartite tricarboxylate transporter substrate binding protein [Sphaerochaetaceae bacterium]|nr:tripartite tricarboxylate transporter substrate binding protein [Sphaerochaetaceae bacterium]